MGAQGLVRALDILEVKLQAVSCELPDMRGVLEAELRSLEEQQVLLTSEPALLLPKES